MVIETTSPSLFNEEDGKEIREHLYKAATISPAYETIEESTVILTGLEAQLTTLETRLSTCASAVQVFELSQLPLTDDRVAHLKAHVAKKYTLYREWYVEDTTSRNLKVDLSRFYNTYSQQLKWVDQNLSNNSQVKTQINELVDQMSKHAERWPTDKNLKDVVEDLTTKVKGCDEVSQSLHMDRDRLNVLKESLEKLIKEVDRLTDKLQDIKKEFDVKLFKIYTIRKEDFPLLDACLFPKRNTPISTQSWKFFLEVTSFVPSNKLILLFAAQPISDITIVECFNQIQYVYLKTAEEGDILVSEDQWVKLMGPVKAQLDHDICWALVTAELVSAVRHIYQYDTAMVEYSCRDLVDFVDSNKRSEEKTKPGSDKKHYCYTHELREGFEYVKVNGILREESRPFEADCREEVLVREGFDRGYIGDVVSLTTVKEVLQTLQNHPVSGCIPVFEPDYAYIKDQIFYGPTSPLSRFEMMHAVNFVGAGGKKEGEKFLNGRSTHGVNFGNEGYFKICYQHVIMCLTRGHHMRYLEDPILLPCKFVYPELLSREKDEEKRRNEI